MSMKSERRTIVWSRRTTSCCATTRSGTHNMYREYRDTKLTGAVDQLYSEMAGRHRARPRSIQIIRTGVVENKADLKRPATIQYAKNGLEFPLPHRIVRAPRRSSRARSRRAGRRRTSAIGVDRKRAPAPSGGPSARSGWCVVACRCDWDTTAPRRVARGARVRVERRRRAGARRGARPGPCSSVTTTVLGLVHVHANASVLLELAPGKLASVLQAQWPKCSPLFVFGRLYE